MSIKRHCGFFASSLVTSLLWAAPIQTPSPTPQRTLDIAAAIETTRFMGGETRAPVEGPDSPEVLSSPGGTRYVVRLIRGDLERNGVWMEIVSGRRDSFAAASRTQVVARLFTHGYERYPVFRFLFDDNMNPVVWLSEHRIAFRWTDDRDIAQVVSVDLDTHEFLYLTHQPTDVRFFDVGPGGRILFAAASAATEAPKMHTGPFGGAYVMSTDGFGLADGLLEPDGLLDRMYAREVFVWDPQSSTTTRLQIPFKDIATVLYLKPIWSASGRYVILDGWAEKPPADWLQYVKAHDGGLLDLEIRGALDNPDGWFGRQLNQLYVADTRTGSARVFWNAPTRPNGALGGAWSPDENKVVLGPTYLPLESSAGAADPAISAVVVVTLASGQVDRVAIDSGDRDKIRQFTWTSGHSIVVSGPTAVQTLEEKRNAWHPSGRAERKPKKAEVRLTVEEDVATPPRLYAIEQATGHEKLVFDPNPELLNQFRLGRVVPLSWVDDKGLPASGVLCYPVDYVAGRRYPLVIQVMSPATHLSRFNLYGAGFGLGPSQSIYAAQSLASRGIAVLSMPRIGGGNSEEEVGRNIRAYEAAIHKLDSDGVIDPARVALVGESRPGWLVTQSIAHSRFVYRAAIASDAADTGYVVGTLMPGFVDRENGGPPFGATLAKWLERSAGFTADRIRTPLRLEDESLPGGARLMQWELFARLRTLGFPVEYYVIPDIERGSHILQNPQQIIAAKEGAMDWLDFWLTGHEDPNPLKTEQYARWHRLREQRDAALKTPRPPELQWTATPIQDSHPQ